MISYLNDTMIAMLVKLNATHYSIAKNYGRPYQNQISSFHFFTSNIANEKNCYPECAYFMPDMNSISLGKLSGFNIISRPNGIDTDLTPLYKDLTQYLSTAVVLETSSGQQALYINHILINDDKDLPSIKDDTFWDKVKSKYNIEKPKTIKLLEVDQLNYDLNN